MGAFGGALAATNVGTVRAHAGLDASCATSFTDPAPTLNLRRQLVVAEERRLVVAVAVAVQLAPQATPASTSRIIRSTLSGSST